MMEVEAAVEAQVEMRAEADAEAQAEMSAEAGAQAEMEAEAETEMEQEAVVAPGGEPIFNAPANSDPTIATSSDAVASPPSTDSSPVTPSTANTGTSLIGTYSLQTSENVEEYLKNLGVGLVRRKVHAVARPNCFITHLNNRWTVTMESVFNTQEVTFTPQEKFRGETYDGRLCETTVDVLDGGKVMIWHQVCEEGQNVEANMSSTDTGFDWQMKCGQLSCKLTFRRGLVTSSASPRAQAQDSNVPPPPVADAVGPVDG